MALRLKLGMSPCPNDTFMFDALVNKRIDTGNLQFDFVMEDVEALNQMAFRGELDITKLSYAALFRCIDKYALLRSGSALGYGCGPLLIAKKAIDLKDVEGLTIAVPGLNTTAFLLYSIAFPGSENIVPMIFSDIEQAVLSGEVDAGLIIHENRFTYQQKGLVKVLDLGEYWEKLSSSAIPLGGIAMLRKYDRGTYQKVDKLIAQSVQYAFDNPEVSGPFISQHAAEMDQSVQQQHIHTYVNRFSIDLGDEGIMAVEQLRKHAAQIGFCDLSSELFY